MSKNLPTKMRKQISVFFEICTESFTTISRDATHEICQGTLEAILWEANLRNERFYSF